VNVHRNWFTDRLTDYKKLATDVVVTVTKEEEREKLLEELKPNFTIRLPVRIDGTKIGEGFEVVQDNEFREEFGYGIDDLTSTRDVVMSKLPYRLKFRSYNHAHDFIVPRVAKTEVWNGKHLYCKDPEFEDWKRCEVEAFGEKPAKFDGRLSTENFEKIKRIWKRAYSAPHMIWFLRALAQHLKVKIKRRSGIRKELLFAKPGTESPVTNLFMTDSLRRTKKKERCGTICVQSYEARFPRGDDLLWHRLADKTPDESSLQLL
jgi:hypothetical protein